MRATLIFCAGLIAGIAGISLGYGLRDQAACSASILGEPPPYTLPKGVGNYVVEAPK
jgi:hypothetical protein